MNTLHRKMKLKQYFLNCAAITDLLFLQNVPVTQTTLSPEQTVLQWKEFHKKLGRMRIKSLPFLM